MKYPILLKASSIHCLPSSRYYGLLYFNCFEREGNMIFKKFFKKKDKAGLQFEKRMEQIKGGPTPAHVAIIMDGNGRWAEKRGLPRSAGHRQGVERVRDIITTSAELGIKYLTLYAFSTENWKRPQNEVDIIM